MWTIIKFDKKKINFLKKDLKKKLGPDCEIYIPKIESGFQENKIFDSLGI